MDQILKEFKRKTGYIQIGQVIENNKIFVSGFFGELMKIVFKILM